MLVFYFVQNYGLSTYQQFRLRSMTNDQALNAKLPTSSAGSLQLYRAGCEIESYNISGFFLSSDGSYISAMPMKRVESDGFALNTSFAADIILALEGSNNGDDWSFIGQTSDFRKTSTGVRFFGESSNIEWRQETYDLRAPWPLIATSSVTSIVFACGFGGLALLRCIGRTHRARPFFCLVCLALASINFVAGLAYIAQGLPRECFYPLWICAVFAALGSVLWLAESVFFEALVVLALLACVGRCAEDCLAFDDCSYLSSDPPVGWILLFLAGALVLTGLAWRTHALISTTAVESDRALHGELWRDVAGDEGAARALEQIAARSAQVAAACTTQGREARHYNRARRTDSPVPAAAPQHGVAAEAGPAHGYELIDSHRSTVPGSADRRRPVRSLGQLYAQALAASVELRRVAGAWAADSGGRLSYGSSTTAEEKTDVARSARPGPPGDLDLLAAADGGRDQPGRPGDDCDVEAAAGARCGDAGAGGDVEDALLALLPPAARDLVRLGAVKGPARAAVKAAACYGGDVSRLTDLCRARLVFDDAAGVAACLERICADAAVRVVRVKDGMGGGELSVRFRVPRGSERASEGARASTRVRDRRGETDRETERKRERVRFGLVIAHRALEGWREQQKSCCHRRQEDNEE